MIVNSPVFARSAPGPAGVTPPPVSGDTLQARNFSALNSFTSGRLGFYIDYSELSGVGTHHFAIRRICGTNGAVGCTYTIYDNDGTTVLSTGTLSWADGEADIKLVSQLISSKSDGTHRTHCQLSSATGGATLHFGANHTIGYGVIDDGTVSSDAVFMDEDWAGATNGTEAEPYNDIYTAIANIGSARYLYGKGTTTPSATTNLNGPYQNNSGCINVPATRTGEADRLYIEKWPGFTWAIDGTGQSMRGGFFASGNESYHTYRGIDFSNLSNAATIGVPGWAIWYHYGSSQGINTELCTGNEIAGGTGENTGAVNLYGIEGGRIWRCSGDGMSTGGDYNNGNTAWAYSYLGDKISIQRCDFGSNMNKGSYQKKTLTTDISFNISFCHYRACHPYYSISGGGDPDHNGIVFTGNLLEGDESYFVHISSVESAGTKENEISGNYGDGTGHFDIAMFENDGMQDWFCFNNIADGAQYLLNHPNPIGTDLATFLDYNCTFSLVNGYAQMDNVTKTNATYATDFGSGAGDPNSGNNDVNGNPNPANKAGEDYTLAVGSSAIGTGMGGIDMGIYTTGVEKLGPTGIIVYP